MRSRPWRSRGPWFSNRAGSRRRGFRDDEILSVAHGFLQDGDDHLISDESETVVADDVLLPDAVSRSIPESMLATRVDVSGLLAIGASGPGSLPTALGDGTILDGDWPAHAEHGGDESLLSRHSA